MVVIFEQSRSLMINTIYIDFNIEGLEDLLDLYLSEDLASLYVTTRRYKKENKRNNNAY